jgi:hypothetical protein
VSLTAAPTAYACSGLLPRALARRDVFVPRSARYTDPRKAAQRTGMGNGQARDLRQPQPPPRPQARPRPTRRRARRRVPGNGSRSTEAGCPPATADERGASTVTGRERRDRRTCCRSLGHRVLDDFQAHPAGWPTGAPRPDPLAHVCRDFGADEPDRKRRGPADAPRTVAAGADPARAMAGGGSAGKRRGRPRSGGGATTRQPITTTACSGRRPCGEHDPAT